MSSHIPVPDLNDDEYVDRDEFDQEIAALVPPGAEPVPYVKGLRLGNNAAKRAGMPLPLSFKRLTLHNAGRAQQGEISSTTAHLSEVCPLVCMAADFYAKGSKDKAAVCLGGAAANATVAPMFASNWERTRQKNNPGLFDSTPSGPDEDDKY